jgi:hypothetical protein
VNCCFASRRAIWCRNGTIRYCRRQSPRRPLTHDKLPDAPLNLRKKGQCQLRLMTIRTRIFRNEVAGWIPPRSISYVVILPRICVNGKCQAT